MFSGLRKNFNLDFLDEVINNEQSRQQQQQPRGGSSARRTPSSAGIRRGSTRGGVSASASARAGAAGRLRDGKGDDGEAVARGPDPDDFVIGDDASDISRVATPALAPNGEEVSSAAKETGERQEGATGEKGNGNASAKAKAEDDGLPLEVQQKLAKLDNLTKRYSDLLKNYRIAHANVAAIEPFEATLREHTPLTSISDPSALVEFLNQRSLQSDMVKDELRRISEMHDSAVKERDHLKAKLEEAEKKARDAFDEAAGLRRERDEANPAPAGQSSGTLGTGHGKDPLLTGGDSKDDDAFFSYEDEVSRATAEDQEHEIQIKGLKSTHETQVQKLQETHETEIKELTTAHESEIVELQRESKEQKDDINELSTENATLRVDVETVRVTLDAMENKLQTKEREKNAEIASIVRQLDQTNIELELSTKAKGDAESQEDEAATSRATTDAKLVEYQDQVKVLQQRLEDGKLELERKAAEAVENLGKYKKEHEENLKHGNHFKREEKRLEVSQKLVKDLQGQIRAAENAKKIAETKVGDLESYVKRLEGESEAAGKIIESLRTHEADAARLERKLAEAEQERDDAHRLAESKKGHESAVASLRSQLKRAEKDRDAAYGMILECGKCSVPSKDDNQDTAAPTEDSIGTPQSRSRGGSETTDVSTQPTEVSTETGTLSVDGGEPAASGEGKKKKKKPKSKSKAKKQAGSETTSTTESKDLTVHDLLGNPELASNAVLKARFGDNPMVPLFASMLETMKERTDAEDEHEGRASHLEGLVEQGAQVIRDKNVIITARNEEIESLRKSVAERSAGASGDEEKEKRIDVLQKEIAVLKHVISEKDAEISKLGERLRGEAVLQDEIETLKEDKESLQEDVLEHGKAATDAKHELKELTKKRNELQSEFDKLQAERDDFKKSLKDAEAQKEDLTLRCTSLEAEISDAKKSRSTEADERVRSMEQEKEALQASKEACEKQIAELKAQHSAVGAASDEKHKSLIADLDSLRSKSSGWEKELAAEKQLAQSRFKDLTDLREAYNRLQPELKRLRDESKELKSVRTELEKTTANIKKLETKERDLKSEISEHKSRSTTKDNEIASLKDKAKRSDERSRALEDSYETARKDLEKSENTRNESVDTRDKLQSELNKVQDELKKARPKIEDLEQQVKKFSGEASRTREELQIKTAQHASSQSHMDSMQDQTRELATQMKEYKEKNDSLEDDIAESRRLLSERSREGETMRRMLADVEGRADARVKEARERMDLATEERDRAENDASTIGRKRAREVEELKTKLRDAERDLARATDERQVADRRERDFKSRQGDLERSAAQAQEEANEVRLAMAKLRDTLDETERTVGNLEKDKGDLRKTVNDRDNRLEKLQKSSKSMAEELRLLQSASKTRTGGSGTPTVSSPQSSRVTSPAPRTSNGTSAGAKDAGGVDFVYLKNVLLQFLETKEKKHQEQLVPALGILLRLEPQDQKRLTAAIAAR